VQQQAARRQAEPAAGEAEGLPVLVLTRLRRRAVLYCVVSCYSPQAWAPPVPSTAGACARPDKAKAWSVVLSVVTVPKLEVPPPNPEHCWCLWSPCCISESPTGKSVPLH
jgi:hypothetical protein